MRILIAVSCAVAALTPVALAGEPSPTPHDVATNLHRIGLTPRRGDHAYRIPSSSMEPTLHCPRPQTSCLGRIADRVLARPYPAGRRPARGDIVAVIVPPAAERACGTSGTFIKRVVGLPGETIHEDGRGFLFADGRRLREPYLQAARRRADVANRNRTWKVGPGRWLLLGDSRAQSCDSRNWGAVPASAIVGRILGIYWPDARVRRI